jgi:hypothetical protein
MDNLKAIGRRLARPQRDGPPPLLFVALLCGVAVQSFLTGRFPSSADGKLHLYRLIELDHALRNGYLFPRWSPDLVYGYGFPLFNYYAPLPYYLGSAFHLIGISYQVATQMTFVALIVLAGWAAYRWIEEVFGPTAGIVGAAAYVYAPYMGHVSVHRGALGEVAGLALMPLILWTFTRLADGVSSGRFALAALSLAALLLAHNLTSLLFAPILLAGLLTMWLANGRDPRRAIALLGATGLGLALGAIFWLPAFAERDLVQIDRLFGPAAFDFRLHFLSLRDVFIPPTPIDPRSIRSTIQPGLGLPQVALALVAVWGLIQREMTPRQRALTGATGVGTLVLVALTLPFSLPLWETVSLLRFVQFPWRLLGPASLLLAFVSGAATFTLIQRPTFRRGAACRALTFDAQYASDLNVFSKLRHVTSAFSVLAMAFYGMWWLFGVYEAPLAAKTIQDVQRFEIDHNAAGTTSFVDYLPATVSELPLSDGLAGRYAESDVIARLSPEGLPENTEILSQNAGLSWAQASVESPTAFTATWDWFDFPGWQATVDGEPVPITPSDPHGLIQIEVPAGRHEIAIQFGLTPIRLTAGLISLVALLAMSGVMWRLPRRTPDARPALIWRDALPVAGLLVLLFAARVGYLNHAESIFRRSRFDGQAVRGVDVQDRVLFEDQIVYLGYDGSPDTVPAGETLEVTFYWAPQRPLDVDYSTSAALRDAAGNTIAQADSQHPGEWPTSRWEAEQYAADLHGLTIPPDTPPGQHSLYTAVYTSQVALAALDEAGNPTGTSFHVMSVEVTRPDTPPDLAQIEIENRLDAQLSPAIALVGYDLSTRDLEPGDTPELELVWHALEAPTDDVAALLNLSNDSDEIVLAQTTPLVSETYPTSAWPAGEVVRGRHRMELPTDIESGQFALSLSIEDGSEVSLGEVRIVEPAMPVFDMPDVQHEVNLAWMEGITLVGYDLPHTDLSPGEALALTLYWTTPSEQASSYKVFVHLVDAAGEIHAQIDQIPAEWTRPTTSWQPGEVITDPYALLIDEGLPPGDYTLRLGLYEEQNLDRLPMDTDEALFLELAEIHVTGR